MYSNQEKKASELFFFTMGVKKQKKTSNMSFRNSVLTVLVVIFVLILITAV